MDGEPRTPISGADLSVRQNPKPRPTDRAERASMRALKLVGFICACSMVLNVVLVVLLHSLFPLVRVQPALVQFSDEQFVTIEPMFKGSTAEIKVREGFARQYIKYRETIDLVTDQKRWQWIETNSHPAVWQPFITRMDREKVWATMEREGLTQEVNILGSWMLVDDPNRWQVEFERIQRRGFEVVDKTVWIATYWYGRLDVTASDDELFNNPFRLRVDRYSISSKEQQEN